MIDLPALMQNDDEIAFSLTMTSPNDVSALFDRVRPVHLSAVIPRARLFKQYHKDSKRMKGKRLPKTRERWLSTNSKSTSTGTFFRRLYLPIQV